MGDKLGFDEVRKIGKLKCYKLKDLCHLEKGKQIDTDLLDKNNTYKYINGGIEPSGYFNEFNTSGQTITVSEGGASCGYVNYMEEPFWCGCHCYRLTDIKVNSKYLYYALKGNQEKIMTLRTGSAMPNIKKSSFEEFELYFDEDKTVQQKVVNIMDKLVDIITTRKCQLERFDALIKARFVEMFGNVSDNQMATMEDVCKIITDGTHQPPKFETFGIPFLFISNIVTNEVTYDTEKFISEDTYNELIQRTPIELGDVLLSTVGSYGHPAVVKETRPFCFQRHIAYLKPDADKINSVYLHGAILSDDVQRQIEERVKGIAQKTLNLSEIRKLRLPLPPMGMQKQFAAFVQATDKSKLAIQKSIDELQTLFDSLMQEYFG